MLLRRGSAWLLVLGLCTGCERDRPVQYPAHAGAGTGGASGGGPVESMPAAPTPPAPRPPPPPVRFTELLPLTFKTGAGITPRKIAGASGRFVALSPDGNSWVLETDLGTQLFTPTLPQGVLLDAFVPDAVFSADGSRLLVWGFGLSAVSVVDVASGRVLAKRAGQYCAARFGAPGQVVFHESHRERAQLFRMDVASGAVTPLGLPHVGEYCSGSGDGRQWLAEFMEHYFSIDGTTGELRPLPLAAVKGATLAKGGARYCVASEIGFDCVRMPDGRAETVWKRPTSDFVTWDVDGQFALITFVDRPDGVYDNYAFVDFGAMTVLPLRGIKGRSGSMFALHPGGQIISMGSSSGVYAYDVGRGRVHFAAGRPLFSNRAVPGSPRRIAATPDDAGQLFVIDVP